MAEAPKTEPERVCVTCKKVFTCPNRSGNKDGCINYEQYKNDKKSERFGFNPYQE